MEAAAAKLMDFSQPMDVALLDQVVTTAFDASHPQVRGLGRRRRSRRPRVVCPGVKPPESAIFISLLMTLELGQQHLQKLLLVCKS